MKVFMKIELRDIMNNREKDLLKLLYDKQYGNQILLSEEG